MRCVRYIEMMHVIKGMSQSIILYGQKIKKQDKYDGLDNCERPCNLTQTGFKSSIFQPMWPWNFMDDLEKHEGTSSILFQAVCIILKPSVNSNLSYSPETLN